MRSLIAKSFKAISAGEPLRLFRSDRPAYADGAQLRDFVYVRDCAEVILWCLDHPKVSGLFNVGSGVARSWDDLANALYRAMDKPPNIEFIDMPSDISSAYQYRTCANMNKLRAAGYDRSFTTLDDGVLDYVNNYLKTTDPYR
jgi:ADP-L-glycero-D-manno-heptose 6-epimerase